jgi:hypothetical protein
LWPRPADSITPNNFERIEPGMTLEQVEGILGQARNGGRYPAGICYWVERTLPFGFSSIRLGK